MAERLTEALERAQAEVDRLKRAIAGAPCSEVGHRWVFMGGANCGCFAGACCSVDVHECEVCGDCDYGDTPEMDERRTQCDVRMEHEAETDAGRRALKESKP